MITKVITNDGSLTSNTRLDKITILRDNKGYFASKSLFDRELPLEYIVDRLLEGDRKFEYVLIGKKDIDSTYSFYISTHKTEEYIETIIENSIVYIAIERIRRQNKLDLIDPKE